MTERPFSLRLRLIGGVLALVTVIWLAVALVAWFETRHETEEILDAHLAQAAALLTAFVGHEAEDLGEHLPEHRYLRKVTFQVWEDGTRLRVHSANAPDHRLAQSDHGFSDTEFDGRRWRVYSVWSPDEHHLVQVGETREARDSISAELARHLLAPLVIALPLLALALALLIGRGLRPLSALAEDIGRRDASRLDPIDAANAPRELKPVLDRLNQLFAHLGHSLEQERRFTADAAHELRTPLAAMRTHAQVAQGAGDAAARGAALTHVIEATDRATHLLEQLLTLARLDADAINGRFAPCDLHRLAAEAVALAAPTAIAKDIELSLADGPAIEIRGEAALLGVLLRNLIDNAVRYSQKKVGAGVTVRTFADGGSARVEIVDQGPGIPAAERARVLDRFYRVTGSDESGSGLGLSIAARIAELHGARLTLDSGPDGKGLSVRVVFPPDGTG
ncbi:MAG: sensor histidine kinase N-terminal domain-containing protein [Gammaproteobacteria bacterium]|nr:sensor histidine kinase N-terminal domain-containing protein [Gammaproteobacteria bacterium]MBU1646127.1 sensor histidine kinase N-terminal domain-containing protein [Gammaproteobacteria bacterium]MBU1972189.1 sensor histidine kinase N-terminal domain-containing protein [Gammaproteobacteria bacterium]